MELKRIACCLLTAFALLSLSACNGGIGSSGTPLVASEAVSLPSDIPLELETQAIAVNIKAILDEGLAEPVMPDIDYASPERVIFHGGFGLFVYDLANEVIASSVDLAAIQCEYQQGDMATGVMVSSDGEIVYLINHHYGFTYIYDVKANTLAKEAVFVPEGDLYQGVVWGQSWDTIREASPPGHKSIAPARLDEDKLAFMYAEKDMPLVRHLSIMVVNEMGSDPVFYPVFSQSNDNGPAPGTGLDLPPDAAVTLLHRSVPDLEAIQRKTQWTEEESARLREALASMSLLSLREGYERAHNLAGAGDLLLQAESEGFSLKLSFSSEILTVTVDGNLRYYDSTPLDASSVRYPGETLQELLWSFLGGKPE